MGMKKKAISNKEVKHLYAPQYPSLSIEKILEFANQFQELSHYMPDQCDIPLLPRQVSLEISPSVLLRLNRNVAFFQWILNVCYTIIGQPFSEFVKERMNERNEQLAERQDLNIEIDPQILSVIQNSSQISTTAGSSYALLKAGSKRKRSRADMAEARLMQESQLADLEERESRIRELEREVNKSKSKLQSAQGAQTLVDEMLAQGFFVLQADGTYTSNQQ